MASAAGGGLLALLALLAAGQVVGLMLSLLLRGIEVGAGSRAGILVSLAAVGAEIVATIEPSVGLPVPLPSGAVESHLVPMALTIAFLWIATRAGRRAAGSWPAAPALARVAVAAAGAGVPVAFVAALAASLVTFPVPSFHATIEVGAASAALWSGLLAGAAAAAGASLEAAPESTASALIRGGVRSYGWALGLLVVGVVVIATLEPEVTRAYVDGIRGNGSAGLALFGAHLLMLPAQSALLLLPAAGSCLELLASGATAARLCPWEVDAIGPLAHAIVPTDPLRLSPWCWLLLAIPPGAAFLGGRRAGTGLPAASATGRGALAGIVFAAVAVLGAMAAAPRIVAPSIAGWLRLEVVPWSLRAAGLLGLSGVVGGAIGGWLGGRGYEEPELPRPTSA
jgi:hypothetical protein